MAESKTDRPTWLGSSGEARHPTWMTAHLRTKRVLATSALVVTTSLMWSDTAISWWANIVSFFLRVNYDATTSVMSHRQNGDADLHAILWGITAVIVLIACSTRK